MNLLKKHKNFPQIEFYGPGGSGLVARNAHYKFFRLGVPCIAYEDYRIQVMSAALLSSDCVVVAISATGSTGDVINSIQAEKKIGSRNRRDWGINKSPGGC